MALFLSFITALFVTMLLIPPLMRTARRLQFVDLPDERKVHAVAIPRIGGVAIVVGALLPVFLWLPASAQTNAFLLGSLVILVFGVWDDRVNLNYRIKLLGQVIAVGIVVGYGGIVFDHVPLFGMESAAWYWSVPLTILFLLGVTNAINLTDGLDGLAGGTALLSVGAIALLAFMAENLPVVLIALAVVGSILGFLRFNTHPATVFMGDCGSQFLGFCLGVLALMLTQNPSAPFSPALPLLLLALPILDTATVMVQRMRERRSPFSPDKNHIHHKLLRLGLAHHEAVFLIYILQAGLVLLAFYARFESDALVVGSYLAFCVIFTAVLHTALHRGWRLRSLGQMDSPTDSAVANADVSSNISKNRQMEERIARFAGRFALYSLPIVAMAVALFGKPLPADMAWLATMFLITLAAGFVRDKHRPFTLWERGALYAAAALLVFIIDVAPGPLAAVRALTGSYFVLLAFAIVAGFRFARNRAFELTTLDFLVIFVAFAVPFLPGFQADLAHFGQSIAQLMVLFYGIELALGTVENRWCRARVVVLCLVGTLAGRGLVM